MMLVYNENTIGYAVLGAYPTAWNTELSHIQHTDVPGIYFRNRKAGPHAGFLIGEWGAF